MSIKREVILPCPFCGGVCEIESQPSFSQAANTYERYRGWCDQCSFGLDWHSYERDAIDAWNQRACPKTDLRANKLVMPNGDVLECEFPTSSDWAKSWTTITPSTGNAATGEQDWELVEHYGLTAILDAALASNEVSSLCSYCNGHGGFTGRSARFGEQSADCGACNGAGTIMLQIAAADDEQRKWERRWNVLLKLYGHDKHPTDEDGRWCLRDFIDYAGAACGFQKERA